MMTVLPTSGSPRGAVPPAAWSPWALLRAQRATRAWASSAALPVGWYVPLGLVARRGVYWDRTWHAWASPSEARLGRSCAHGCSGDTLDRVLDDATVDRCLSTSSVPLQLLDLTDLFHAYRTTHGWAGWADPQQQALARYCFVPRWIRATQRGQSGWRHPQWSWLFIPDWTPLAPFNTQMTLDDRVSLGQHIATIVPAVLADDRTWLDTVPYPIETTLGMQFAVWQAMGLGYFDRLREV